MLFAYLNVQVIIPIDYTELAVRLMPLTTADGTRYKFNGPALLEETLRLVELPTSCRAGKLTHAARSSLHGGLPRSVDSVLSADVD